MMTAKRTILIAGFLIFFILFGSPGFVSEAVDTNAGDVEVSGGPAYNKKGTVSLDFENADLKNVLKAFSMQTGINFIASDIIESKKITVFLSNVSVESALISILDANGLIYETQPGNVYLIKPSRPRFRESRMITRIFRLNYLQVYEISEAMSGQGSTSGITIVQPTVTESGGGGESSMATGQGGASTGAKENIIGVIQSLMSKYGSIIADRRNNSLVITDIPDVFPAIEETLKKLDIEPVQVMIQAELVETSTSAIKRLGLEYGDETALATMTYTSPTIPTSIPLLQDYVKSQYGSMLTTNPAVVGSGALFKYGTLSAGTVNVVLKMLSIDRDTKYLSRPKILTVNNEPAIIKVSAQTAIGINSTSVSLGPTSITAERAETGVILKVTPQVNDKGDIFMYVEPSISRAVASTLSTTFQDPSYRTSANTVMVHNEETVVVSGLIQTNNFKTLRKVPILGDIPIIGEPFKSRYKQVDDTELLIFITPHIVKRRDMEIKIPPDMTERSYLLDRTLDRYTEERISKNDKAKKKDNKPNNTARETVVTRDDAMNQALNKYTGNITPARGK